MFNSHATWAKDAYVKSGNWKCAKSPTGSHHWKGNAIGRVALICEHCKKSRVFRRGFP